MFLAIRSQFSRVYSRMAAVLADGDLDSDRSGRRGRYRVGGALVIGTAYGEVVARCPRSMFLCGSDKGGGAFEGGGTTDDEAHPARRGEDAVAGLFKCFDLRGAHSVPASLGASDMECARNDWNIT